MPFVEGGEYLVGANGAELDTLFDHRFEGAFELGPAVCQSGWRANGPRSPRKRLIELWVMVFDRFRKIYIAGDVSTFIPLAQ